MCIRDRSSTYCRLTAPALPPLGSSWTPHATTCSCAKRMSGRTACQENSAWSPSSQAKTGWL
eukprot:8632006-Alexandrium_andersonii.AAC.1